MNRAHILVLPYPVQGHVIPLMQISHELVKHGIKITFVTTEFNHKQIMKALAAKDDEEQGWNGIRLVSIPDGLEDGENRNDIGKLTHSIRNVMPKKLEMLIQEINNSDSEKISCVVADGNIGMALEVAEKMGIRRAAFWPASAAIFALSSTMEKLLHDGILDPHGTPTKDRIIQLSPAMPPMRTKDFVWTQLGDMNTQKIMFNFMISNYKSMEEFADWVICNSAHELEPPAFAFINAKVLPIGPLSASKIHHVGNLGSFWPEDSTCLNWLDQQPHNSVIYIAFGSFTVFDHTQLKELALGLELSNKPFLWVVRSDINHGENYEFLKEFEERLLCRGKVVGWAPQQKVLTHPSIACFLSHCGWNSTTEGVTNGVPFLCWPYFADQFVNETYICDIWKVGLRLDRNQGGVIGQEEIMHKVKQLLSDEGFKTRALELKGKLSDSVKEGGGSNKNLENFVDWIKS